MSIMFIIILYISIYMTQLCAASLVWMEESAFVLGCVIVGKVMLEVVVSQTSMNVPRTSTTANRVLFVSICRDGTTVAASLAIVVPFFQTILFLLFVQVKALHSLVVF